MLIDFINIARERITRIVIPIQWRIVVKGKEKEMIWFILFLILLFVNPPLAIVMLLIGLAWNVFAKKGK